MALDSLSALTRFSIRFQTAGLGAACVVLVLLVAVELLGAVGGEQWDDAAERPEAGLLRLREALGLYANLRPARVIPGLEGESPLRREVAGSADILVVRELTGGLYYGAREEGSERASDTCVYTRHQVERIAHVAFAQARRRRSNLPRSLKCAGRA